MGKEKFCSECGQSNKGKKITFFNLIHEIFNGFFNFDAKFWKTIIPLLLKPGEVSKNYINGKRQRYSNPFQFYLTVSIVFFILLGVSKRMDNLQELQNGGTTKKSEKIITFGGESPEKMDLDPLQNEVENSWIPLDSTQKKQLTGEVLEKAKDTLKTTDENNINFDGLLIENYMNFHKKHPKININSALDSLQKEQTFYNRFMYDRAKVLSDILEKEGAQEAFFSQFFSAGSVALFVFLPLFTLLLKLFYIRRKKNYVAHLIFVFHTQTVFFMLLSMYILLDIFNLDPTIWVFLGLFLCYLFMAMKNFYQQGFFKTFFKFLFLNIGYTLLGSLGIIIVFVLSFMLF